MLDLQRREVFLGYVMLRQLRRGWPLLLFKVATLNVASGFIVQQTLHTDNRGALQINTGRRPELEPQVHRPQYLGRFVELSSGRVFARPLSSLPLRYIYHIGWVSALGVLCILTTVYSHVQTRSAPESAKFRRQATPVATGDGESCPLEQVGFAPSKMGDVLFYAWLSVPVFGYIQLACFTLDYYILDFHVPDQTWAQLGEPFLLVFIASHTALFLQSYLMERARVFFMTPVALDKATKVLVESRRDTGFGTLCTVKCAVDKLGRVSRYIEYTCLRYIWDERECRFRPSGEELLSFSEAKSRFSNGGLSDDLVSERVIVGPNHIFIEVPSMVQSMIKEFLTPIYIFQFSCIWVYMYYSTWNIATIWLLLAIVSGTTKAFLVRRNLLKIQEMAATQTTATVLRGGSWTTRSSAEIVPGDIVAIENGVVPCDIAILDGCAVVNESMLTGEPMPVQRFAAEDDGAEHSLQAIGPMKRHFLFAGTQVLQSSSAEGAADGRSLCAVGLAVTTGARTAKGSLVRMVLFPTPTRFQFTEQLPMVYTIMCILVVVLFSVQLLKDQGHWVVAAFTGLSILTQSLQPNMPVSFTLAHSVASTKLKSMCGVLCLSPDKIPVAGKVQLMVLDKTGTITKDGMDFAGVHPVDPNGQGRFLPVSLTSPTPGTTLGVDVPQTLRWAVAACHSVTKLETGTLVGNAVEVAMLCASGWELADDGKTVRELQGNGELQLLRRLEFDHSRMTSGAVVKVPSSGRTIALIKGSYEKVEQLVSKTSPFPQDFKTVAEQHASEQYYVLGVGMKELQDGSQAITRDTLESGLTFLGLILFRNEMKPDSPAALAELKAGAVRCVMCTGDNALTAVSIGRKCGMIDDVSKTTVILGDVVEGEVEVGLTSSSNVKPKWISVPEGKPFSHEEVLAADAGEVELALTRSAFKSLLIAGEMMQILNKVRIYARMKPEDKVTVIKLHQDIGLVVGMVGDGGNDCGALRAAHVGLALSEAEASIVAPFSSGEEHGTGCRSLRAVPDLLRFGRATLATNLATYMYFIVYALSIPVVKLSLVFLGNMMPAEWLWIFIDIIVGSLIVALMTLSTPAPKLAKIRPTSALVGARSIITIFVPFLVFVVFFSIGMIMLWQQPFYVPYDSLAIGVPSHQWSKKGDNYDTAVAFFFLAMQLPTAAFVFSYGAEFRCAVWRNFSLLVCYVLILAGLVALLWSGPSELTCMFRVNCDSRTSNRMYIPVVQEISTGNIGGCFLGPQLLQWREKLGSEFVFPTEETDCNPHPSVDLLSQVRAGSGALPGLGAAECRGPNNCFDAHFRMVMSGLTMAMVVTTHILVKLISMWHPAQKRLFDKL